MTACSTLDLDPVVRGEQLTVLERLVSEDADGMAVFGEFYGRASSRLAPLLGPHRRAWLVRCDGVAVGFVDTDNDAGRVHVSYFVAAAFRGRGVARQAVARIVAARVWPDASAYVATIADGNAASAGVVRAAGFSEIGRTDDRESLWEYRPGGDDVDSARA